MAGPVLDLDTIAGRLQAVCVMVNCCESGPGCWWHLRSRVWAAGASCTLPSCSKACTVWLLLRVEARLAVTCKAGCELLVQICWCRADTVPMPPYWCADRVMCLMVNRLPPLDQRQLLWQPMSRGRHTTVMLVPTGARKEIQRFKEFAKENGTDHAAIQAAYKAAAAAAKEQAELRRQPFLVHSVEGSTLSGGTLYVDTTPLGYRRRISTEQVQGWAAGTRHGSRVAHLHSHGAAAHAVGLA